MTPEPQTHSADYHRAGYRADCPACQANDAAIEVGGLDAAWAEAEAALRVQVPGREAVIEGVSWERGKDAPSPQGFEDRYHARAYRWDAGRPWERKYADGPTPAAALLALAAALRSTP